jgi:dihydrofolate reductase
MKIILIAALDLNNAIGYENKLLWNLPNDLQQFKAKTLYKTILMGRKTYQSISKILPSRNNWVLSNSNIVIPNATTFKNFDSVLKADIEELWVIGGNQVYLIALPYCSEIHITRVHTKVDNADAYFPTIRGFKLVEQVENKADNKHAFDYDFERWVLS